MSPNDRSQRVAVGIDLGTTFSVVAYCDGKSSPRVLKNSLGKRTTPSVVCFQGDEVLVGQDAKDEQACGELNAASFFKRHMGDANFSFSVESRDYSAAELSTFLLKKLKEDAEAELGRTVTDAIVTVPAYFNNFQRQATLDAARAAGLNPLRALNEPTAAALAFGVRANDSNAGKKYLVYDLGGGTFDVSIIAIDRMEIRVLATDGDHLLGGKDWDDRLLTYVAERFKDETGLDLFEDVESVNEALVRAERAKIELSAREETKITASSRREKVSVPISRNLFEELSSDLFERTATLCESTLRSCSPALSWNDLEGVLLVGGSTRMPAVARFMQAKSGRPVLSGVNVDEAVAIGAAIQAAADLEAEEPRYYLNSTEREYLLESPKLADVCSHTLGMIAENDDRSKYVNSAILKKNATIPAKETKRHKLNVGTVENPELEVYLLQGEHERPLDNVILGKYVFSGFQRTGAKEIEVDVTYSYDRNGVVDVVATQVEGSRELKKRVETVPDDMAWTDETPKALTTSVPTNLSIVFAVDVSTSMLGKPIVKARKAFLSFVDKFDLGTTRIGVIRFADRNDIVLKPTRSPSSVRHASSKIKIDIATVGIANAAIPFDSAYYCFTHKKTVPDVRDANWKSAGELRLAALEKEDGNVVERRVVVVLTDGRWNNQSKAINKAKALAAQGIDVVAVGFGGADRIFLQKISTMDEGALFTDLSHLEESFSTIAQTIKEVGRMTRKR
ncbi:MAG: Hsp70 family protein [Thermoguttaceae bacterium]|nr:Hsp70 family protein [Thermoguttaceae bacterium]